MVRAGADDADFDTVLGIPLQSAVRIEVTVRKSGMKMERGEAGEGTQTPQNRSDKFSAEGDRGSGSKAQGESTHARVTVKDVDVFPGVEVVDGTLAVNFECVYSGALARADGRHK